MHQALGCSLVCDISKHLTALCTTDTKLDQQVRATPYSTAPMLGENCPLNQSWGGTCLCCPNWGSCPYRQHGSRACNFTLIRKIGRLKKNCKQVRQTLVDLSRCLVLNYPPPDGLLHHGSSILLHSVLLSLSLSTLSVSISVHCAMFSHVVFGFPLFLFSGKVLWMITFSK